MNNMKPLFYSFLALLLGSIPSAAAAQTNLINPLGTSDPREIIGRIIQAVLGLSGTVALIMFIYGGLMFLTSSGNPGMIDKAKKILIFAILGIIVIAGAYVLTNTIFQAVTTGDPVVGTGA